MSETIMLSLGVAGGLLCAAGDVLLDLKGPGNEKLGTSGNIDSNWTRMPEWRFRASVLLAFFGVPMVVCGLWALAGAIGRTAPGAALAFQACTLLVACGAFFVHESLCVQAVLYKRVVRDDNTDEARFAIADDMLEGLYRTIMPPFVLTEVPLTLGLSALFAWAVVTGALPAPAWCALVNPLVFTLVGPLTRRVDPARFQDLPGIVMPSLSLAGMCVVGLVALS